MRMTIPGVRLEPELTIDLEGRPVVCHGGDSIASALIAADELACRISRSGQSRGVFCGMGVCQECVMLVDGRPARACMTAVRPGAQVRRLPADPLAAASHAALPSVVLDPELLVVGAGPAGLAAAAAAAEAGVEVVVIDERAKPGGQYFKQPTAEVVEERLLDNQYREGRVLIERVRRSGVSVLEGVQVWAVKGPRELFAVSAEQALTLRPQRLVVATGAYERGVPMPGWTLPGFMTTGAAQTLMRSYQVLPGSRILVSGNGPLNLQVAAELVRGGATVAAVCEAAPIMRLPRATSAFRMGVAAPDLMLSGIGYLRTLRRARVPLLEAHAVVSVEGPRRVRRATIAALDPSGHPIGGSERRFDVDAVCIGFGFIPATELMRSLGAKHRFDAELRQLVSVRDRRGRSSLEHVWVVGDGGGIGGARLAKATGTLAGLDVAESLGRVLPGASARARRSATRAAARNDRFQRALSCLFSAAHISDQFADLTTPICRCEEVSLAEIDHVFAGGISSLGALKRLTRAGMGRCQGRYCAPVLAELAARRHVRFTEEADWFAPAPPFKPLPVGLVVAATAGAGASAPAQTETGRTLGPPLG